jgi:hypothetical protein
VVGLRIKGADRGRFVNGRTYFVRRIARRCRPSFRMIESEREIDIEPEIIDEISIKLSIDDVQVLTDLCLSQGFRDIAAKLIAARSPKANWVLAGESRRSRRWCVRLPREIEAGSMVFVQARSTGKVSEVRVGEIVSDKNPKNRYVIRAVLRSRKAEANL